ncbi:MAG: PEP-utilizing enzyme [Candidatus Buchananbacteria bacterium]
MEWEIFDKFYNAHWFLTGYSNRNFSELLRDGGNTSMTRFIGVMENDVNFMIFDKNQFSKAANYYADKMINDDSWRNKMYKKHSEFTKKYFKAGEDLKNLAIPEMSDGQILKTLKKIIFLQKQVRILGVLLNGLVLDGRNHLSNKLRNELQEYVDDDKNFDHYWSILTQPTKLSLRQKKDIEIAKLANLIKSKPLLNEDKALGKIYEKYCWLDYMYYGPPIQYIEFESELRKALKNNIDLNLEDCLRVLAKQQQGLMSKLKFNTRAKHLVKIAQLILWQKSWRKDVEYHGLYCYEPLFREIAKRKNIKDWRDVLYLLPWELESFILKNKPRPLELQQRRKFSCLIVDNAKSFKMLIGQRAKKFYKGLNLEKKASKITETKGQVAFAGKAKGIVKIIFVPKDMAKMKQGDILVSQATSPDLLPAMKKAAAIITNVGGLIAHAAITARELKIPCIVGTTNATEIFKDGDLVEVDATKGIVKKI